MNKKAAILLMIFMLMQVPVFASDSERTTIYYNNGVAYFKDKKYSSAIIEFKKVLRARPYDKTVQNALAMAYLSRGKYYINSEKAYKKGINDYRSALTYLKYWDDGVEDSKKAIAQAAEAELKTLVNAHAQLKTPAAILAEAKNLRGQTELAASIYVYTQLFSNSTYQKEAYSTASDIYKSLNNEKKAIDTIRDAISYGRNDGMLHFKYAIILDDIGNEDGAIDEFQKALEYSNNNKELLGALQNFWMARSVQNPRDSQSLINLGAVLQKQKQFELAKTQYLKARQINPNDSVILINLASVYTEMKEYDNAIRIYDEILTKNKNDLSARYYKGKLYEQKGDISKAMAQYREILSLKNNDQRAQEALNGLLSNLSGEQLLGYLKNEADTKPNNYDAQFKYAYEMHKNKKYEAAIIYYKKAIEINSKNPEPYINLAQIFLAQNDTRRAANVVAHGLSNIPNNKDLKELEDTVKKQDANDLYAKGTELYNKGDYKGALQYYSQIKYRSPEIATMVANFYVETGETQSAIDLYKKILKDEPKNEGVMLVLGNLLINSGQEEEGKKYINQVLSINPNNKDAKETLAAFNSGKEGKLLEEAISLYENKKYNEALELLNKIVSMNSKNAYAYYYKGAIFEEQNKLDNALIEYKKSINADSNFALGYYMTAVALDNKEQYKEAVTYYDKYSSLQAKQGVNDEYTKYAKERAKELKNYLSQNK